MPYGIMSRIPRLLPPNKNPTGTRCITLQIPDDDDYERDLHSVIGRELATWVSWERDSGKNATKVAKLWKEALKTWSHCDNSSAVTEWEDDKMPHWEESCVNGKYVLRIKVCECPEKWETIQFSANTSSPGQPGGGNAPTPPPPGGSQQYCYTVQATSPLLIPVLVNTGDVITLQSTTGGTNDGSLVNFLRWFCGDGRQLFGTSCIGSGYLDGADPVPTVNHMSVIARIDGNYYGFTSGSLTVPSGVVNAQLWLQVNDPTLTDNQGNLDVCISVANNQSAPAFDWCRNYPFTTDSFAANASGVWVYSLGTGWVIPNGGAQTEKWVFGSGMSITEITVLQVNTQSNANPLGLLLDDGSYIDPGLTSTVIGMTETWHWAGAAVTNVAGIVWTGTSTGTTSIPFISLSGNTTAVPLVGFPC